MADASEQGREDLDSGAEGQIVPGARRGPLAFAPVEAVAEDSLFADVQTASGSVVGNVTIQKLLRRKWTMLAAFVLVAGMGILAVWKFVQPEYKSTAMIHIAPVQERIVYDTESGIGGQGFDRYVKTQIPIIRGQEVLSNVLDRSDVKTTSWYGEMPFVLLGDPPNRLERLAEILAVAMRPTTEMVFVSVTVKNPGDAKVLVDAVVEEYHSVADDQYRSGQLEIMNALDEELKGAEADVRRIHEQKLNLAKRYGGALPEDVGAQMTEQFYSLEAELRKLQIDQRVREMEINRLRSPEPSGAPTTAPAGTTTAPADLTTDPDSGSQQDGDDVETGSPVLYAQDSVWYLRNDDLNAARHSLEIASQGKGPNHPDVRARQADLEFVKNLLQDREKELDEGSVVPISGGAGVGPSNGALALSQLEYFYGVQEDRVRVLQAEVDALSKKVNEMGETAKNLGLDEEELAWKSTLRDDLRKRLEVLRVEARAPGQITIGSFGLSARRPSRDRRLMLTAMVLFAALMAGVGVGYFSAATDTSIHEVSDVDYVSKAPFLGQLPFIQGGLDLSSESDCDLALEESVRMVRTNLLQRLSSAKGSVVAITSAGPSAGKTTLAVLLARSLQQVGKKVLLVDGDVRQPTLSRSLGAASQPGLVELLSGVSSHKDVLVATRAIGCHLLPAGRRRASRDSELLANGVFSACIKKWKEAYDFVIVDGPPILSLADGRILAGHADGSVMVLRASLSTRKDAVAAYAGLSAAGGSLLGTVLVGTRDKACYYI